MLTSLSRVTHTSQGPQTEVLTSKEEIEEATLEEYELCLHQTEGTPLMSEPLVHKFGFLGTGPVAEAVA